MGAKEFENMDDMISYEQKLTKLIREMENMNGPIIIDLQSTQPNGCSQKEKNIRKD